MDSFILPHIVRERKDFVTVKIKNYTNLDKITQESIQFHWAVPWALLHSGLGTALRNCMLSFTVSSRLLYSLTYFPYTIQNLNTKYMGREIVWIYSWNKRERG